MEGEREVHVAEAVGDVGVVLVGLDHAEPGVALPGLLEKRDWLLRVECGGDDGIAVVDAGVVEPVVAALLALAASYCPDELDNGVVEVELHA